MLVRCLRQHLAILAESSMMATPESTQKTSVFAFYLYGGLLEELFDVVVSSLRQFRKSREWSIEPPEILISEDPEEDGYRLGGHLKIYSVKLETYDKSLDLEAYNDVVSLVDHLEGISFRYGVEVECDLDDESIGVISNGVRSKGLSIGLLQEWQRHLGI